MPLLVINLYLVTTDFPICTELGVQNDPCTSYENDQYYVFWTDSRVFGFYALYGARISTGGTVLDPDGKLLFQDSIARPRAAYDGSSFLVVWREGC